MDFTSGAIYRRRDLHATLGGQRQGGISTPRAAPAFGVILLAGMPDQPTVYFSSSSADMYRVRRGCRASGDARKAL